MALLLLRMLQSAGSSGLHDFFLCVLHALWLLSILCVEGYVSGCELIERITL